MINCRCMRLHVFCTLLALVSERRQLFINKVDVVLSRLLTLKPL